MKVRLGDGKTKYGPGVLIELTGDEVAIAIDAYLAAHSRHVFGPRTITVNGELCEKGEVYVDPAGFVIDRGNRIDGGNYEECDHVFTTSLYCSKCGKSKNELYL